MNEEMTVVERLVRSIDPEIVSLLDAIQKTDPVLEGADWRNEGVEDFQAAFLVCIKEYGDRREAAAHNQYKAGA